LNKPLEFEAIKYKFQTDEDGEASLILRVNMQDQISAFAIPAKKRLKVKVEVMDE
jgi:hypothetical protein